MASNDWLRMWKPDFNGDGILKLVPKWEKFISVLGLKSKNNDNSLNLLHTNECTVIL